MRVRQKGRTAGSAVGVGGAGGAGGALGLRGLSSAMRIVVWTVLMVIIAVVLLAFGVSRFGTVGAQVGRARAATTVQRSVGEVRQRQTELYDAFARVDVNSDTETRVKALTEGLVPSEGLFDAWKDYRAGSLHLPGERDIVERYAKLTDEYEAVTRKAGAYIATVGADPATSRQYLGAVAAKHRDVMVVVDELDRLYDRYVTSSMDDARHRTDATRNSLIWGTTAAIVFLAALAGFTARSAHRRDAEVARLEREREETARRNEFEAQLQRALAMASNEPRVYEIVERAFAEAGQGRDVQMLIAEGPHAAFDAVVSTNSEFVGCSVESPVDCVAARLGQTFEVAASTDLDACPYLRAGDAPACSAVCVPVVVSDRALGVVHMRGPVHEEPDRALLARLKLVARRTGEKIGSLRAFARSQAQASTDPLTGLANRRTLEDVAGEHVATGAPYAIAYGDLDHFKQLNDTNGHEIGDRALRVFARVLESVTRPGDVAVRYGGEEFVLFLADCDCHMAVTIAERVRETLRRELAKAVVPEFTVSFGVATSEDRDSFDGVLRAADEALLTAKASGRDCVKVTPAPGATSTATVTPARGAAAA